MRFSATREDMRLALAAALKVAPNRANIPILGCVLIDAGRGLGGNGLAVTANDLDQSVTINAAAEVERPGRVAVDAQKFAAAVLSLHDGADFLFDLLEGEARATLKSGRARFAIPTLPAQDFPVFPVHGPATSFDLPCATLAKLLDVGASYARKDAPRLGTDRAYFHRIGDKLRMVSTDSHRFIWCEVESSAVGLPDGGICIPDKSVKTFAALTPEEGMATIAATSQMLAVDFGQIRYSTKLGGDKWFEYQRIIPASFDPILIADVDLLTGALARAAVMADEKVRGVRLDGKPGSLALSSRNMETGQANDEIDVDYEGPAFTVTVDVDYLIDAVDRVKGENVRIGLNLGERPQPMSIGENQASDWFLMVMPKTP